MLQVAKDAGVLLLSYEEAVLYCTFLIHNGYSDWRLPTVFELYNFVIDKRGIAHPSMNLELRAFWVESAYSFPGYRVALPVRDIVD